MTTNGARVVAVGLAGRLLVRSLVLTGDAKAEVDFVTRAANSDLTALAGSRLALERAGSQAGRDMDPAFPDGAPVSFC